MHKLATAPNSSSAVISGRIWPADAVDFRSVRSAGSNRCLKYAGEAVRVALLGSDGPTGRFTRWENQTIPW